MNVMNETIITCSKCKITRAVCFIKKDNDGAKIYTQTGQKNDLGLLKRTVGLICHDCRRKRMRVYKNETHRDLSKRKQTLIAVASEKIAEERFSKLGFSVKRTDSFGPDLICKIGNWTYMVEVKRAFKHNLNKNSWRTQKVSDNRIKDDLIAVVLPNDYVYIDSMENHLRHCTKYGFRTITSIVKEFGLTPLPTT